VNTQYYVTKQQTADLGCSVFKDTFFCKTQLIWRIPETSVDDGNWYISVKFVFLSEFEALDKVKPSNSK